MRTFYFADENFINTDYMSEKCSIDIEIGTGKNDFEITIPLSEYDQSKHKANGYIYSPETEFGGRITKPTINTSDKTVKMKGIAFRGLLEQRIVMIPQGQTHRIVSGELNSVIGNLFGSSLYGGLFVTTDVSTGITGAEKKLKRYGNYLESAEEFLSENGYKLRLEVKEKYVGDYVSFFVEVSAEPIIDHSDYIENSQDGELHFKISKASSFPYTHAILLGKGELQDRLIVLCSINSNGKLTEVSSIPDNKNVRVLKYENTSIETKEEIIAQALDNIKKEIDTDSQSITISDFMVELGDIVGGRDYVTGTRITEPVTNVIYKISSNKETYSYKIGVDGK